MIRTRFAAVCQIISFQLFNENFGGFKFSRSRNTPTNNTGLSRPCSELLFPPVQDEQHGKGENIQIHTFAWITSITLHKTFHEPTERTRRAAASLRLAIRLGHGEAGRGGRLGEVWQRVELLAGVQLLGVGQEPDLLGEAVAGLGAGGLAHGAAQRNARHLALPPPRPRRRARGRRPGRLVSRGAVAECGEQGRGPALGAGAGRRPRVLGVPRPVVVVRGARAAAADALLVLVDVILGLLHPHRGLEHGDGGLPVLLAALAGVLVPGPRGGAAVDRVSCVLGVGPWRGRRLVTRGTGGGVAGGRGRRRGQRRGGVTLLHIDRGFVWPASIVEVVWVDARSGRLLLTAAELDQELAPRLVLAAAGEGRGAGAVPAAGRVVAADVVRGAAAGAGPHVRRSPPRDVVTGRPQARPLAGDLVADEAGRGARGQQVLGLGLLGRPPLERVEEGHAGGLEGGGGGDPAAVLRHPELRHGAWSHYHHGHTMATGHNTAASWPQLRPAGTTTRPAEKARISFTVLLKIISNC